MRRTHLIAVLIGILAVGVFAADASAYYHPGLGVFTSRDPGPGRGMRVGAAQPAAGRFIPRDPAGQYADGVNVYQYAKSSPTRGVDPSGRIVVLMSGWNRPQADMTAIRERIILKLKGRLRKYDRGGPTIGWAAAWGGPLVDDDHYDEQPGTGSYDDFLRRQFDAFIARKRRDPCSLEQFIAVGHSSGASAILNQIKARNLTKFYPPAFLGMIDPVLSKYGRDISVENGGLTQEVVYYQRDDWLIKGDAVDGADENIQVQNTDHLKIPRDERVVEGIAEKAAVAYELRVGTDISLEGRNSQWSTRTGRMHNGQLEGNYW